MQTRKSNRGVEPPPEIVEAVRRLADEVGDKAAGAQLGVGAGTVRALRGGLTVHAGTIALVQRALGLS